MKFLRFFLFPFALLYGLVVLLRNGMYKMKWFRSTKFSVPIINVGNLSMGGTGKTPHVEYLIRLLEEERNVVTLSRGFGRKTQGFRLAGNEDSAKTIGDEPFQYFKKFGKEINVAVDAKRVLGVVDIMRNLPETNTILLDDAFQHRAISPGFNILLTTYDQPYSADFILPMGDLREFRNGKNRADVVVLTKCPSLDLDKAQWRKKLGLLENVPLFFSKIKYGKILSLTGQDFITKDIILVTGIAKSEPLKNELSKSYNILHHFNFNDHHNFTIKDLQNIHNIFGKFADAKTPAIITTEKDAMRLQGDETKEAIKDYPWFYQEISVELDDEPKFNQLIKAYVKEDN
ncbi:MAG: tetraacyldisaccharide 4'-kinase [Crocinitomicaceae bacterium]|nr:tetraacyldisaccharide 4'-kinase [Crocinitomicaceae bacterium]